MNSKISSPFLILLLSCLVQQGLAQDKRSETIDFITTFKILVVLAENVTQKGFSHVHYPIFTYGNKKVDSLINSDVKNVLFPENHEGEDIAVLLNNWAEEGLESLDFTRTYESEEFLSFQIEIEACAAYCSHWTIYFNYSLSTGIPLTLLDVVDTLDDRFKKLVIEKRDSEYNRELKTLKELFDDSSEEDSVSLEWALQLCESCQKAFKLEQFALYSKHLELIEPCEFPQAIRCYSPFIELKFQYDTIKEYLRTEM